MKVGLINFIVIIVALTSCKNNEELSKEDFSWMPYKGNETLIFKSNKNDIDTIFLLRKDTILAYPEPQALNGRVYEVVSVSCRHFRDTAPQFRYMEGPFLELRKSIDAEAELDILLNAKGGVFYKGDPIKLDVLQRQPTISIATQFSGSLNVYKIFSDQIERYGDRSDFVPVVYWSRSLGLVRFDQTDSIYWELVKKY